MSGNIGSFIKEKREIKGLSQRQLAELTKVSNTEISRIESGQRRNPAPYILKRIAPYIGVSYRELLEKAGYKELLVNGDNEKSIVQEFPETYINAVRDFCDKDLTPEEIKKLEEFKKFLLSQRKKKE